MPEIHWDSGEVPTGMRLGLMTWVTDDPYIACGECGKPLAGAVDEDDIEFATLGDLLSILIDHVLAAHNG